MKRRQFCSLAGLGGLALDSRAASKPRVTVHAGDAADVDQATLLAIDDLSIPLRQNLFLTLHSPERHPENPVLRLGPKGTPDEYRVQFYGSILHHDNKFKMWYVAADDEAIKSLWTRPFYGWRPAYAESLDGIHWTRPNLGLVEYNGNKNNNLLLVEPPEAVGLHLMVLHEPEDPDPSRQFKMMLTIRTFIGGKEASTSVPLFSADGLRWKVGVKGRPKNYAWPVENCVLPKQHFEQAGLFKWNGMYHLTGQQIDPWIWLPDGQPCGRVMTIFRSPDLVHWSGTRTLGFVPSGYQSKQSGRGEESHMPASTWNRGNVLFGLYGQWHGAPRTEDRRQDLGLLISNDGLHFREPVPNHVFLHCGEDGQWDQRGLITAQAFHNAGGQTFIWYGNWDLSATKSTPHCQVGLLTMRQDGFGSLSAKNVTDAASLLTCPLTVQGAADLYVNAEGLSRNAWLRIELVDPTDRPVPAYSGLNSVPLHQSGTKVKVTWKDNEEIRDLRGRFRVRVALEGDRRAIRFYGLFAGK